ncbi:39S ribosomal protein L3, mitochondrial-like [Dreissena polymorpha]|uniref:Large ribosomal subunit protein uL3m n=1 Tax=Dreissena polymorpha TaxID=45954 RepID=A0A9D4IKU6_DREPO|nr:39S ribosomal protein L3, mitochondrial-like [Dreissena polymorpha]KAH3776347.1 hypothetical protein DPMN_177769 [Dreissena polymorpha]
MAVRGLFRSSLQILTQRSLPFNDLHIKLAEQVSYTQVRGTRSYKRPLRHQPRPWHIKKKASSMELYVTPENKAFLREAAVAHYNNTPSPLRNEPWPRNEYTSETIRTGVIGVKIGVIPQWKKDGTKILCQLIQVVDNHVIRYNPPEKFETALGFNPHWKHKGIGSVVVGALSCTPFNYTRKYTGLFSEAGVPPKRILTKFWITPDAAVQPGTPLSVMHFRAGDYVDVSAKTVARGFQGVMKKWGYKGGPASHGSTKFHRKAGSVQVGKKEGFWKGKKMPGMMGENWRKTKAIKIWRVNTKLNLLYLGTGVPGPHHGYVRIYDSRCHKHRVGKLERGGNVPMPTFYADDIVGEIPEEIYDDQLYNFADPSVEFSAEQSK